MKNRIIALTLAVAAVFAAGLTASAKSTVAQFGPGGPVPLCAPDVPTCTRR